MISLAIWCWRRSLNKNPLTISPTFRLSPHCTVDETNNVSRTYGVSIYHPPITMPPSATSKGVHLKSEGFPLMMLCEDLVPMSSLTDRPTIREQSKTFSTIISWILYNDVFTSIYSIAMPLSKCRGLNNPSSTPNHNLLIIGQTIKQPKNCRVPLLDNIGTFASELTHTPSALNNNPIWPSLGRCAFDHCLTEGTHGLASWCGLLASWKVPIPTTNACESAFPMAAKTPCDRT